LIYTTLLLKAFRPLFHPDPDHKVRLRQPETPDTDQRHEDKEYVLDDNSIQDNLNT
jgi:hypothetical protein